MSLRATGSEDLSARAMRLARDGLVGLAIAVVVVEFFGAGALGGAARDVVHATLVFVNTAVTLVTVRAAARAARDRGEPLFASIFAARGPAMLTVAAALVLVGPAPRIAGTFCVVHVGSAFAATWSRGETGQRFLLAITKNPLRALALSFASVIAMATVLLMSPAATVDGRGASFVTALFTSTSAVCVTGLAVVDTGTAFTMFGQSVILLAVQLGATGVMILAAGFAVLVGGDIPFAKSARGLEVLHEAAHASGLRRLVAAVVGGALITELAGTLALFALWSTGGLTLPERYDDALSALYWSFFHAVSAFANAGFALQSDSLSMFVENPVACGVFALLITLGGLGFVVLSDVVRVVRAHPSSLRDAALALSLQAKVVLSTSLALFVAGTISFLFFEYDGALSALSEGDKLVAAMFQSVTFRTAGFNTVPFGALAGPTVVIAIALMFIGASPGGTGGGLKTTTFAVVVMSVRAMLRNRPEVELFHRTIPKAIVYRATAIVLIAGAVVALALTVMLALEPLPFEQIAFEVVSAFATVGLSMDVTPRLSSAGQLVLVVVMFAGRVGPLSLALAIGGRFQSERFRYAEGRIAVG